MNSFDRSPHPPVSHTRPMAHRRAVGRNRRCRSLRFGFFLVLTAVAVALVCFFLLTESLSARKQESDPEIPSPSSSSAIPDTTAAPDTEESSDTATDAAEPESTAVYLPDLARTHTTASLENLRSQAGVLISMQDYTILAEKNSTDRIYPASITKVMTLIVACEQLEDLDAAFTFTSALIDPVYLAGASLAGFQPNETVPVRDILYGMILPSGGEAAVALAVCTAGSESAFAELMNRKAEELHLSDTHFVNSTGLHDEQHYSTCEDLAKILAYAMQQEKCREVLSTYQYTTTPTEAHPEGISLTSTMFSRMYGDEAEGISILAGKTGYTPEAHQCLASYAERNSDGAAFVFVSVGGENRYDPIYDAIDVYATYAQAHEFPT